MNLYEFYQAKLEYSTEAIATDAELVISIQEILIWLGFLQPPADGKFDPISTNAFLEFQENMSQTIPELTKEKGFLGSKTALALMETSTNELPKPKLYLTDDLASRISKYLLQNKYQISTRMREYNIVYIKGMNPDGTLKDRQPNSFNDIRIVIEFQQGKPTILGRWEATTEPKTCYNYQAINSPKGLRITLGQHKAWKIGMYGISEPHEALIQVENVTISRDLSNENQQRETGLFDIHQHWGYDLPRNSIAVANPGCLVGRTRQGHQEFMKILKQDRRYQQNQDYCFWTSIISGEDLQKQFPASIEPVRSIEIVPQQLQGEKHQISTELATQEITEVLRTITLQIAPSESFEMSEEYIAKLPIDQQLNLIKQSLKLLLNKLEEPAER